MSMKRRILSSTAGVAVLAASAAAGEPRATVTETIDALGSGSVSAEAAVQGALDSIAAWKELNAVARLDGDRALEAARAVDACGRSGPLAGLPLVVKDNIQVEGLPAAAGTPAAGAGPVGAERAHRAEAG
jgi:indoleacetamide hydrolase